MSLWIIGRENWVNKSWGEFESIFFFHRRRRNGDSINELTRNFSLIRTKCLWSSLRWKEPLFPERISANKKKKKEIVTWRSIQSMNYGQRRYSRASEYQYNETNLFLMMSMGEKLVLNILYRWKIDCEYQNRNKNWYTITMDRDLFIIF